MHILSPDLYAVLLIALSVTPSSCHLSLRARLCARYRYTDQRLPLWGSEAILNVRDCRGQSHNCKLSPKVTERANVYLRLCTRSQCTHRTPIPRNVGNGLDHSGSKPYCFQLSIGKSVHFSVFPAETSHNTVKWAVKVSPEGTLEKQFIVRAVSASLRTQSIYKPPVYIYSTK